jgi:hypothetical protein
MSCEGARGRACHLRLTVHSLCSPLGATPLLFLSLQIEPREEQCFYEDLSKDKNFRLEFEVVRGGLLDCKLKITDPFGQSVIEKIAYFNKEDDAANEAEGRVTFVASHTGKYSICFDNTMSRWTAKVVSFFVLNDAVADPKDNVAKLQDLGPTVDSVIKIADELDAIETIQHHMRVREQSHRDGQANNEEDTVCVRV